MEAVMGGINSIEVKPREYFGVDLQSGEITWRWLGPPARTVPGISFASGTLPNGRPRYSQWSLPDCVPVSLAGAWQGRLFLADASAGTLRSLPIGALQDELPIQPIYRAEDRPRMSGIAEKYVSERLAAASPREREEALSGIVSEDGYLPAWKEFVVGLDGTLFLERAACGEEPGARKWEVLTPDGEWLGSLTTPRAFYIRAGARDRIVAIVEDSLGVQRIEVHALEIRTP
jgi:hypothetical protein